MVQISIALAQLPVLSDPKFSVGGKRLVAGTVTIETVSSFRSGGLRLFWTTTIAQRVVGKNDKVEWKNGRVVDFIEVVVLDETVIPAGTNVYDFVVRIPTTILDTRTSHFDRVRHTLSAAVLEPSPTYHPTEVKSTYSPRSVLKALRKASPRTKTGPSDNDAHLGGLPLVASCSKHIPVFSTHCSTEHDPSWRYSSTGVVPNLGAIFRAQVQSSNLALGGVLEYDVKFEDLPANATLHAVKLSLGQETTPVQDETDEPSAPMNDEYALLIRGQTGNPVAGRSRPEHDTYIWRGETALALDDLASNTPPPSPTPHVHARASLPSPIIGALPTYDLTTSGIALVSHVLKFSFFYSILGQDLHGKTLDRKDGQLQEGSIRCWSFEKELLVASDTSISGQQGPPGYAACSCTVGLEPNDALPLFPSVAVDRTTSILYGTARWPSHVPMNQKVLRRKTMEHFEETEGLCECFADRERYRPDLGKEMEEVRYQMEVVSVKA